MSRPEARRYICKLRLIRHGLLEQAEELDDIRTELLRPGQQPPSEQSEDSDEEGAPEESEIIQKRDTFTHKAIKKALKRGYATSMLDEAVVRARRRVVQEIMAVILKTRKCPYCAGYTPMYRKNRAISIYQKPLNRKEGSRNAQNQMLKLRKQFNPLQELNAISARERKKREQQAKVQEAKLRGQSIHSDEGVADLYSSDQEDEVTVLDSPVHDDDSAPSDEEEDSEEDEEGSVSRSRVEDGISGAAMIEAEPMMAKAKKRRKEDKQEQQKLLNPDEVRACLTLMFQRDSELFAEIYCPPKFGERPRPPSADMFFIKHLLVTPNKYRKETKTAPDEISEAADNAPYRQILAACQEIHSISRDMQQGQGSRHFDDLQTAWIALQGRVNGLIDVTKAGARPSVTDKGIKQKLEKKEGIMRMNVMGKRVNFAARSVISPDPNLEANEVGVPPVFAKKLTYPEPVTTHNFVELKQAVLNGAEKWPGAVAVEFETGQVINLRRKNIVDRQAIANSLLAPSNSSLSGARNKKVYRHLNNGDVVVMNRQPTLHKPSMMGHRAKVLPGEKTIRMHYANTNSYNADFDGDEMNMHFPQNEIARAEAMQIADTDHQYLSTTSGGPLRGLIQDHISMAVWLSSQDTLYTREEYHELLYACIRPENNQSNSDRIRPVDPSIWKPAPRWTGKDVVSTILCNIQPEGYHPLNMESNCKVPAQRWGPGSDEGVLRVRKNYVCTGTFDKKQIGAEPGGIVHSVYEAYGHVVAGKFISILGRLLTRLLNTRGFSCGIEDLIVTDGAEEERQKTIQESESAGLPVAARYVSMDEKESTADDPELIAYLEDATRDDATLTGLDNVMKNAQMPIERKIADATVPHGLVKAFPSNQFQAMTTAGAKGGPTNANRISSSLGQQNLEGRRVPVMISGKTLPSFKPFEPSWRAGGFITDRFLTGVRPQEYFFHAMSGREGLVDTAVKTSRSGYLQRCLIKGLEGCQAAHDGSVRDADGSLIQPLYGEDALEITQQSKISDFSFVAQNWGSYLEKLNLVQDARIFHESNKKVREHNRNAEKIFRKTGDLASLDPVTAIYAPTRHPGSSSETYFRAAKHYIDENPDKVMTDKKRGIKGEFGKKTLETIFDFNYLKSVVPPGDAVGVVAGQSLGEPSTQMTLNTFHMAGSAQNVTLGIPRLREILMAASRNIKTPQMILHFIPEVPEEDRVKFANGISRRSIAEVIDEVTVEEQFSKSDQFGRSRTYDVTLKLYPKDEYTSEYTITAFDVAWTLESKVVPALDKLARNELKKRGQSKSAVKVSDSNPEVGKSAGRVRDQQGGASGNAEGGNDSDADDAGDDDATNTKKRQNVDEGVTYDEPDESDEEIERAGEREASPEIPEDEGYGGSPAASRDTSPNTASTAPTTPRKSRQAHSNVEALAREKRIKEKYSHITAFSFNDGDDDSADTCNMTLEFSSQTPKLLLVPIIKRAVEASLIQEVQGISSATFVKPEKPGDAFFSEGSYIATEGVNLDAVREESFQNIINPNRVYTNSVGHILDTYGVEAAREAIIAELQGVFGSHGITVNRRHLTLVADYMTRAGGYLPFNRTGMGNDTSLFKKMSFETTVSFLKDCALESGREDLTGPSARLTVGKIGSIGTGGFDVLLPVVHDETDVKKEDKSGDESMTVGVEA